MKYECHKCGLTGVKLWRQYQTFLNDEESLFCAECVQKATGKVLDLSRTDQCGWFVPAVPTEDGSFWGYTSVPKERVSWWKALPLNHNQAT